MDKKAVIGTFSVASSNPLRTPCRRKDHLLLHLLQQRHPQPLLEQPALRGSLPASSGLCRRLRRLSALECLQLDRIAHDRYALQTLEPLKNKMIPVITEVKFESKIAENAFL